MMRNSLSRRAATARSTARSAVFLTILLFAATGIALAGDPVHTPGKSSLCPLHKAPMRGVVVPIRYGMPVWDRKYEDAKRQFFPCANEGSVLGGCVVTGKSPKKGTALVCEKCNQARSQWFAGMDANHDGVVSRAEWRGDEASFGRLDRNHDGVLSRKEMEARQNFQEVMDDLMRKQ